MPTNLALDDGLIDEARRIGHQKTKKAAVTEALPKYTQLCDGGGPADLNADDAERLRAPGYTE